MFLFFFRYKQHKCVEKQSINSDQFVVQLAEYNHLYPKASYPPTQCDPFDEPPFFLVEFNEKVQHDGPRELELLNYLGSTTLIQVLFNHVFKFSFRYK